MKRDAKTTSNSEAGSVNNQATDTVTVEETPVAAEHSDVPDNVARVEAVRARAAQLLTERRFAEASSARFEAAACSCWVCSPMGAMCCSRAAVSSACVGRAAIPPAPPL